MARAPEREPRSSTTRLGDWYATLVFARPSWLVLAVSERTLLPVVIPAKPFATLPLRIVEAAGAALAELGIPDDVITAELAEMREVHVAKTASRRVLGSMNDFVLALRFYLADSLDL